MAPKTPKDTAQAGSATGATKATLSWDTSRVAGAYSFTPAREIHEDPGATPSGAEQTPAPREAPVAAR
jgi:hypothetical protein